jgi:hypothetical protein
MNRKGRAQYIANLLLKINAKLGGRNAVLSEPIPIRREKEDNILIMGADVTHPTFRGKSENGPPSIAAVSIKEVKENIKAFLNLSTKSSNKRFNLFLSLR